MESKAFSRGIVPTLAVGIILCLFTGCAGDRVVPAEADAPSAESIPESYVRMYNRRVQYYDSEKGRWQDAGSIQELSASDPYSLAAEKRAALEEALLSKQELSAEQEMLLANESKSLSVGVEPVPVRPSSSSKNSDSDVSSATPTPPPVAPPVSPTEPIQPPSGDGEDIEWSDDYL